MTTYAQRQRPRGQRGPKGAVRPPQRSTAAPSAAVESAAAEPAAEPAAPELEALVTTYAFDVEEDGGPHAATVRFTGSRAGVQGRPGAADTFVHDETVPAVVPGSGSISVTACIYGLHPGEWTVSATWLPSSGDLGVSASPARQRAAAGPTPWRATWSWRRWALAPAPAGVLRTRWAPLAPLARAPAVLPGAYPILVAVGSLVALAMQGLILTRESVPADRALTASLVAIVFGLVGAKVWYAVEHPRESLLRGGWSVDGFLVVVPVVGTLVLLAFDLPVGVVLDASTPGLFMAVAIARLGCFLIGCCAGRCTASRWGRWSSDRRIGARRVPTQLLESATGLVISVVTLTVVLADVPIVSGGLFLAAFAVYGLARQFLLRLRSDAGRSPRKLPVTAVAVVGVLVLVGFLVAARTP